MNDWSGGGSSGEAREEHMPFGSIALTLSYDGLGFAGFARQPGLTTVQGQVEAALATVFRRTSRRSARGAPTPVCTPSGRS